jgi:hypothetical protein
MMALHWRLPIIDSGWLYWSAVPGDFETAGRFGRQRPGQYPTGLP